MRKGGQKVATPARCTARGHEKGKDRVDSGVGGKKKGERNVMRHEAQKRRHR